MKRFFAIFALLSLVALVGCDDVKVGLRSDMYVMYYTSTDGNIVVPKADAFDANIISNTYKDGQGKIAFDIDITTIGEAAFFECSTLRSITIPEGVTTIEYGAFYNCANLKEVTLPEGVATIGKCAFCNCTALHNVTIPASVAFLGDYAFYGCERLESITIPNSVTLIGDWAFAYCTSLTSITIPNGVTVMGDGVFYCCESLTNVSIPDSVTSIGDFAFYDCTSLKSVYCIAITPPTAIPDSSSRWDAFDSNASGRKIYVPAESVEAYKTAAYWSNYAADIVGYEF